MRLALLFSGQGQQTPNHLHILQSGATAQSDALLASLLPGIWRNAGVGGKTLQDNHIAQPFIFAFQMQYWQRLEPLLPRPICAAGYSLGELAACAAAGIFDFKQGTTLATQRAACMDACVHSKAGLLAIMGLPLHELNSVIASSNTHLAISNPEQHYVIGGLELALQHAGKLAEERGAKRVVRLCVQTPSHTPLLRSATGVFEQHLLPYRSGQPMAFKVLSAIDGRATTNPQRALDALARQISSSMDWQACLHAIHELQPDAVLEIGPGGAMARMWNAVYPNIPARSTDDFRSTEGIKMWVDQVHLAH